MTVYKVLRRITDINLLSIVDMLGKDCKGAPSYVSYNKLANFCKHGQNETRFLLRADTI